MDFYKIKKGILSDIKSIFDINNKKNIVKIILVVVLFFLSNKIIYSYRVYKDIDHIFSFPILSFNKNDISNSFIATGLVSLISLQKMSNKKKFRNNEEYGSARWGTKNDIKPFIDTIFENNILFTETERLTMNPKALQGFKLFTARNKNVLVIGSSGSGKTFSYVKPNILQAHSSYVITDTKFTLLPETAKFLSVVKKYVIKVLNLKDFGLSMKYNPFKYFKKEIDILKFVKTLIANTKGEGTNAGDDFWIKAEELLYMSLISLIMEESPKEEQNFTTFLDIFSYMDVRENDEEYKSPIDLIFEEVENGYYDEETDTHYPGNPDSLALRQYKKFKQAAGTTAKSILISCGARLAAFDIKEVREIFCGEDELDLDKLGDRKQAFYVIIPDTDKTFNFIAAMVYSQMFDILINKADMEYDGKLPVHVRCLFDEFANIGIIPQIEILMATIRSREISASLLLQSKAQLKAIYKDNAETIIGNCDSTLFLGGTEESTLKDLSEMLGKETLDISNTSRNRGQSESFGVNDSKLGRELMTKDEIAVMEGEKCIFRIRGARPFLSNKYNTLSHSNYKYLSDESPKNKFDLESYLRNIRGLENMSNDKLIQSMKEYEGILEISL